MPEIQRERGEIDVSVRKMLAEFHEQTPAKLAIAPVEGVTLRHSTNGIAEVGEDGWCVDLDDDASAADAITIKPVSVVDTVLTTHHQVEHTNPRKDTTMGETLTEKSSDEKRRHRRGE